MLEPSLRRYLRCGSALSVLASLLLAVPAAAQEAAPPTAPAADGISAGASPEEIYRKLFGGKAPDLAETLYPVVIAGMNVGDVRVKPGETLEATVVERQGLLNFLVPFLTEEKVEEVNALRGGGATMSLADLNAAGFPSKFDRTSLLVVVDVPLEFRASLPIAMRRLADPGANLATQDPAAVSAAVNLLGGLSHVQRSRSEPTGVQAVSVALDAALNVRGWVLQGAAAYDEDASTPFSRDDVRLTRDLVGPAIRMEAGDLTAPVTALQGDPDIAGIGFYRNFNIRPYQVYRPAPAQEFRLDRPARVSIYINGAFARELRLGPGRYRLTDLPLRSAAANDIELEIRYDSGEVERRVFAAFFDFELLRPGVSEFSANVGFTYDVNDGQRDYQADNPAITAFYRRGVTDRFTYGVNLQADTVVAVLGGEALLATRIGSFGVQAGWNVRGEGDAGAVNLFYRWAGGGRRQASLDILTRYAGAEYLTLGTGQQGPSYVYDLSARYSIGLTPTMRVQASAQMRRRRPSLVDESSYTIGLNRQTRFGNFIFGAGYDVGTEQEGFAGRIGWSLPLGPGTATASYDTRQRSARLSYNRAPEPGYNAFGYDFSYSRQEGVGEFLGGLTHIGNRSEVRLEQSLASGTDGSIGEESRTSLLLASALVYADGQFALARPVYDSFAMFEPNDAASQFLIAADPQGGFGSASRRYSAASSRLGPAVVPDLGSYLVRSIQVDAPNAPAGVSVGGDVFVLKPTFRSGYHLVVGDAGNVSLMGQLVDLTGATIPLAAGYAVMQRDGAETRVPVFTNAGGRFYVEGVQPGEVVSLTFESPAELRADIKAPDEVVGVVRFTSPIVASPLGSEKIAVQQPSHSVAGAASE